MSKPAVILLVDDEINVLKALERQLRGIRRGDGPAYRIETFTSSAAALARGAEEAVDLVLSDYRMPEMNGADFLRAFRRLQPQAARLILSGQTDLGGLIDAINEAGIMRFLAKPWEEAELVFAVETALREHAVLMENARLADALRESRNLVARQQAELVRLERECPGITRVRRDAEGAVLLEEENGRYLSKPDVPAGT
jgi:response regulator RpfG family c-di-GMP phosphodiesterase